MATQFLPYLSQDLTKLFESKKNYDFIINVGKNNNRKEFYLHSIIFGARSTYFEDALSNGKVRKKNNIFIFCYAEPAKKPSFMAATLAPFFPYRC